MFLRPQYGQSQYEVVFMSSHKILLFQEMISKLYYSKFKDVSCIRNYVQKLSPKMSNLAPQTFQLAQAKYDNFGVPNCIW